MRLPEDGDRRMFERFVRDEAGIETIEWGVMAGLFVASMMVSAGVIGGWAASRLGTLAAVLP